jgi:hypothetical protein
MSSIYRKGRDDYFYYQAYVFNPVSKKKDKRIFHSLKTKDRSEALIQQAELDAKYSNKKDSLFKLSKILENNFQKACIGLFFLSLTVYYVTQTSRLNGDKPEFIIEKDFQEAAKNDTLNSNLKKTIKASKKIKVDLNNNKFLGSIPEYSLQRIEKSYGSFGQGKLFLTVSSDIGEEDQRILCKYLADKYSEFSNILICFYLDSETGVSIAKGELKNLISEKQKKNWLAMYTYNPVEGEYFDNNPSRYLGY